MIRNIEDWVETTDGIYKYEIADTLYYELHIYSRYMKDDIQDALASLYLVSKQFSGSLVPKSETIIVAFARMPDDIRENKWEERVEPLAYAFAYELRNKRVSKF